MLEPSHPPVHFECTVSSMMQSAPVWLSLSFASLTSLEVCVKPAYTDKVGPAVKQVGIRMRRTFGSSRIDHRHNKPGSKVLMKLHNEHGCANLGAGAARTFTRQERSPSKD
eukprot:1138089-Pelagomonas_calceolata.AAC.1